MSHRHPSIWSTPDPTLFIVSIGVDPSNSVGKIKKRDDGWVLLEDIPPRPLYLSLYEAANALAGFTENIYYKDYLLGKGEDERTVMTTTEQMKRITEEGGWKMISASRATTR